MIVRLKKNLKKVLFLINAPIRTDVTSEYSNGNIFPPLGILTIGTAVKEQTDWDVKIYDAQITSMDELEKDINRFKPMVVGVSVLTKTYENGLEIAGLAKKYGAITVFGNDHAALYGESILKKQRVVDVISSGEHGEIMFTYFLKAIDKNDGFENVPDMIYRNENGAITRTINQLSKLAGKYKMDQFVIPDRSLLQKKIWDIYLRNYLSRYGFMHTNETVTGVSTINTGRGCTRSYSRCIYCGIFDLSVKLSSPEKFWKEVEMARQQINANVLYEVFDSMSSVPNWIEELIMARPEHLSDIKFIIYAQARDINFRTIELFKRLGVVMVNMGLDSGDDTMLKRLKSENDSVSINRRAVEMVNNVGINVTCSFVCGAPGETKESLRNTVDFAKWIADNKYAVAIEANALTVRKQSKVGDWFSDPEIAKRDMKEMGLQIKNEQLLYEVSNIWNEEDGLLKIIDEAYFEIFTEVKYADAVAVADEILKYDRENGIGGGIVRRKTNA